MPSRGEQLQSYQFMVQRVVSALVLRETDPPQSPFRRAASAAFASVLVAVVIAAGFGVYSIFTGGGNSKWKTEGTVIVEKNSSATFLYKDGKLLPALNLTSAILASSVAKPTVMTVSANSLQKVAWGQTIGIANLPNSLASSKQLAGFPWSVCAMQTKDGPVSAVVAGRDQVFRGRVVGAEEAMLVRSTARGTQPYVLWRGTLYETTEAAATALGRGATPTPVAPAFLNGLPQGQPIVPINVPNSGAVSRFNSLWRVGEVIGLRDVSNELSYVLVREDGLFFVTQLQAQLAKYNDRNNENINDVNDNGRREISHTLIPNPNDPRQPPTNLPRFSTYNGSGLCSVVKDEANNTELRADVPLNLDSRPQTARRSGSGTAWADYVLMPDGMGALVVSGQTGSAAGGTYSYVSRDGVRFAAANRDVLTKLGYDGARPLRLSASLVSLLPEGPGLDPTAALVPITVS
jgi:type VII secretion protein EccB